MPDRQTQTFVSRSAYLALREEERLVRSGYELLDEKLVQIAAELLQQREAYRATRARLLESCKEAAAALLEAASAEGLEALQTSPSTMLDEAHVIRKTRSFVGLTLISASFEFGQSESRQDPARRGVLSDCATAFREIVSIGVAFAALTANLERLMYEYERTERRVRALENVILPEIRNDLAMLDEQLELNDQEEVIRARSIRSASASV